MAEDGRKTGRKAMRGSWILVVPMAMVASACGQPANQQSEAGDTLFLSSPRTVAVLEAGASNPSFRGDGIPSGDWSTVVRTDARRGTTDITALDPEEGTVLWENALSGKHRVKVVSQTGNAVAMAPLGQRHFRDGRKSTKLTVVREAASESRTFELEGNYEPEAFSTDGSSLFVIRYLPAGKPNSYQVRRLDPTTGRVEGVYTPDGHLQDRMGGTARIQAMSPDGARLYTLYTLGEDYAFVHVLSLDGLWAHCIDLPDGFSESVEDATAITLSPDGRHLYVANSAADIVAEVDTESLLVTKSADVNLGWGGAAHAAADGDSTLYVAGGGRVTSVDTSDLTVRRDRNLGLRIRGLQLSEAGARLYVGLRSSIVVLDALSGKRLEEIDPPGINRIKEFGPVMRAPEEPRPPRSDLTCAC
jgi:DNA-binding beta-propeller fold protein YncE